MKYVAVLAVLPFFVSNSLAQDGEPAGVKSFKKTVTDQAASILVVAHPLFVSGKSTEFDGYKKIGDVRPRRCLPRNGWAKRCRRAWKRLS